MNSSHTHGSFQVNGMKQHLNCSIAQELSLQFQTGIATITTLDDEDRQTGRSERIAQAIPVLPHTA